MDEVVREKWSIIVTIIADMMFIIIEAFNDLISADFIIKCSITRAREI
jgi:hypothetical protein